MTTSSILDLVAGTVVPTPESGHTSVGSSASGILTTTDSSGKQCDLLNAADLGSAIALHLALPSLRGFWPMSAFASQLVIESLSPSRQLTNAGTGFAQGLTAGLVPYVTLSAAGSQYFYRADEAGMRGSTMNLGMTWGGWFKPTSLPTPGNSMIAMGKWGALVANQEYLLQLSNSGGTQYIQSYVGNGTSIYGATSLTNPVTSTWYHIVGRWVTSASVDIFVNGIKASNTTSIPAALAGGANQFAIGAYNAGTLFMDGSTTLDFVAGYPLSDAHVQLLYNRTRYLFP